MSEKSNIKILEKVDSLLKKIEEGQIIISISKAIPKKIKISTDEYEHIAEN